MITRRHAVFGLGAAGAIVVAAPGVSHAMAKDAPKAALAPADDANLYIVRLYAEPTAASVNVMVGDVKVVFLRNRHYTAVRVPAGEHKITLKWPKWSSQVKSEMTLTVEPGKTYYIDVTGISRMTGVDNLNYMNFTMGSSIDEVDLEDPKAQIASRCEYTAPIIADLSK